MGEQYIFYVTDDNLKHYSKNVSTPYEKEMASDIINALKDRIQFIKTSVQAAIYRDKDFTFHLPPNLLPFNVFPQLKYGIVETMNELEETFTENLDQKCSLSIVDNRSQLYQRITIKFNHIQNSSKPIYAEIPFIPKGDNLLKAIRENLGDDTWETQEQYLASVLNSPIENMVFRFSNDGNDTILFTFSKIYQILEQFFKNDGNLFQPFGSFNYDLSYLPKIPRNLKSLIYVSEDENILNKFSNSLRTSLEYTKPSQYIQVIVGEIRKFLDLNVLPLENSVIENLKKALSSILPFIFMNFFSCYFTVYRNYKYKWEEIFNIPKEESLREISYSQPPDFELLSAICIAKWRSFINDIVDLFHYTVIKFQTKINPQKNVFFGTIVYSHYVKLQEQQYTLILSRAFVHLYNFAPKSETYEILPETYNFYCGNKTPLIFGSPIQCVKFTQFKPESQIGVLSTTQGHFSIDFGSVKALTDFWLMLLFCQNDVEQPFIKPAIPDLNIKISFPFIAPKGKYFYADIKAGKDKWSKLASLDKCTKNIENIYSRLKKFQTMIPLSSIPKLKEWMISESNFKMMRRNYSLSFIGNSIDVRNNYDNDKIQLIILYGACVELLCSPIKNDQFRFFAYLGISDFNKSITDHSLSLLQYQLKNFSSFLPSYKVQNAPLLHFASMFCDDLKFLQMIIDSVDVNGKDDDKRSALFYSIRSPTLTSTQMLFENNVNPDIGDNLSETPMTLSMKDESVDKTLFLASHGASVNKTFMNRHQSALIYSIENGYLELFEKLLPYCPSYSLNYPTSEGSFLTHILIKYKLPDQLLLLSQRCPEFDPNLFSKDYPHPIHYFFDNYGKDPEYDFNLFNSLLSLQNLDLNIRNDTDQTPLSRCIHIKNLEILQRLIFDPRCDLDLQDENRQSCLYVAIANNNKDAISLLLKAGALANAPNHDKEKNSPIMLAVKNNDISTIELLINYGANPNKWYNTEGLLPQHVGTSDVLQRLKEKGFNDVYQPRS